MGKEIKNVKMSFCGFYPSEGLKKNDKAMKVFEDLFGSGRSIDIDVSNVPDEEIIEKLHPESEEESTYIAHEDQEDYESDCEDGIRDTKEDIKKSLKFCIDFDGTCVLEMFPGVGPDVPDAVRILKKLVENGHRLILWTARSEDTLEAAMNWFESHGIELYAVNKDPHPLEGWPIPRKVIPAWYIDDRNLGTPMKTVVYSGKEYEVVDWNSIEDLLIQKNIV